MIVDHVLQPEKVEKPRLCVAVFVLSMASCVHC